MPPSTFVVARWVKWLFALLAPPLAAGFTWGAWQILQEHLAGEGVGNVWLLAFILAVLGALVLLFVSALAWALRARLTVNAQGLVLRGIFGTRELPWDRIEGYRLSSQQLFVYPKEDSLPLNLSHFDKLPQLYALLDEHLADLRALELAREAGEIRSNHALGWSDEEKAAQLKSLRRIVRPINWTAYVAAAAGGLNALFLGEDIVQALAATLLIIVPAVLFLLALHLRDRVRLDYQEGSRMPQGLTGILAASLVLGLMSLLDPHTLLGEQFAYWAVPLAAAVAGLWLVLEWEHVFAHRRWLYNLLHVVSILFLSGFWAGGAIYQINKHADLSEPEWGSSRVTGLRTTQQRTGTAYHVQVAPWSASPAEPVELVVSRATYLGLSAGAPVEISVRRGALEIPWVDEIRLQ